LAWAVHGRSVHGCIIFCLLTVKIKESAADVDLVWIFRCLLWVRITIAAPAALRVYSAARAGGRRTRRAVPVRRRGPFPAACVSAHAPRATLDAGGAESASALPAAARRDTSCDGEACSVSVDEQRARLVPHAGTPARPGDHVSAFRSAACSVDLRGALTTFCRTHSAVHPRHQ